MSRWRHRKEDLYICISRSEAVRLARHTAELNQHLKANESQFDELVRASEAAALLEVKGFSAIGAARCLDAWSHGGRVRSEAAFAALAGVNPIPASSGNMVRHRLDPGGDRSLNSALHMVAVSRMTMTPKLVSMSRNDASKGGPPKKYATASDATWPAGSTERLMHLR